MSAVGSYRNGQIERYFPADRLTFKASAAVTGGRLVAMTGDMTVGPAGAASTAVVGVALFDAAVGEYVTVARVGVWDLRASAAIAAGDLLVAAAGGEVAPQGAAAAGAVIGRALAPIALGADGPVALGGML